MRAHLSERPGRESELGHVGEAAGIMSGDERNFREPFRNCRHLEKAVSDAARVPVGHLLQEPRPFLALCNAFALPREIADHCVTLPVRKCEKDDDRTRCVPWHRYDDDGTVAVDVLASRKTEIAAAFESVLLVASVGEAPGQ